MEQQYVIKSYTNQKRKNGSKYYNDRSIWGSIFEARFFSDSERKSWKPPLGSFWKSISRDKVRQILAMQMVKRLIGGSNE